jgi:hypothetical protein
MIILLCDESGHFIHLAEPYLENGGKKGETRGLIQNSGCADGVVMFFLTALKVIFQGQIQDLRIKEGPNGKQ